MKKGLFCILFLLVCIWLTGCNITSETAYISNDYSQIRYNGAYYKISNYYVEIPIDSKEISTVVLDSVLTLPVIDYDVTYIADEYPDYLWLRTTCDYTDDPVFKESLHGNVVMYEKENSATQKAR